MLLEGEVVLAGGLGGDGDEEGVAFAELGLEFSPRFELGDFRLVVVGDVRVKAGAWALIFRMRSSIPVLKRSSVAFSEMARRSGWTRARVFWVIRSSWSCKGSFALTDMAPLPLKCVKV